MSSGFVSGATTHAPIQRSDAWLAAQLELEAERKRKADAAKAQAEGKSLYETLEANKGNPSSSCSRLWWGSCWDAS
jgi:hypothetical protein